MCYTLDTTISIHVCNTPCVCVQSLGALQGVGLHTQQHMGLQKPGGQGSLPSTWSDPSVNINLDFLSAGLGEKNSQPSLNNIIQQQGRNT